MNDKAGFQTVFRAQPHDGDRKIQKRNRPPVSCLLCRTRKVKCDRQHPCERCVKSGEAAFCEYAPRGARKPRPETPRGQSQPRPQREATGRPALQLRLRILEDMVNGLVRPAPQKQDNFLETPSSSDQQTDDPRSELSTPNSSLGLATAGPLTAQGSDTSYVGATHWASILESIHDIRGIIDEIDVSRSPSPQQSIQETEFDFIFGSKRSLTLDQAVARLPPKNRSDQLVLLYFRSRFLSAPYIHTAKFQREYDRFWQDPGSTSLLWLSILASILSTASMVCVLRGDQIAPEAPDHPERLAVLAEECLAAGDYLAAKPYSIEALLLQALTEMKRTENQAKSIVWAKFGLLVRLAQRMGYHRDPKHLPKLSAFEGEMRRRAWFFIEVFDCLFSFQLGMPPIVRDDECDTESPINLYDTDFDEDTVVLPPARPPTEPTTTLYLCIKSVLCRKLRRVVKYALAIHPPTYEEILQLDMELHQIHEQVPAPLKLRPVRLYSFTDNTTDIIHRLLLELMYLKSLCVLHRKYINTEKSNPRYAISRTTCVEAAVRILELHAEYDDECKPAGRLYEDRHQFAIITLGDYLIAATILCLDLTENISVSQGDRSKKMKVLGTSYKIFSERKHISKEAAHATRVVGAILRRVSLQEQQAAARTPLPPPPPPQPDVRDGSLASLLNDDTQTLPPMSAQAVDQSHLVPAMEYSFDFLDTLPIDSALNDPSQFDWNMIDQFLLGGGQNTSYA